MNNLLKSITELTASIRKEMGGDINITVAECPSYGHNRISIIIDGSKHDAAAAKVVEMFKRRGKLAKVEQVTTHGWCWDTMSATDAVVTYSTVTA